MALLEIVTYPNRVLETPGEPVTVFDEKLKKRVALVNPEVLTVEGEQTGDEGCLSFPGIFFPVKRSLRAVVRAQDVNGQEFEFDGLDLEARCMLHETDHCDGVVFIDRTTPLKRELVRRKIKRLQKQGRWV